MSSPSAQLSASTRMGMYEPLHQISAWGNTFNSHGGPDSFASTMVKVDARLNNKHEFVSHESMENLMSDQGANKPVDKVMELERPVQRRLAQNREAARKSRIRKKAYVRQLETSNLKLAQLQQELDRARQQGAYIGTAMDSHLGLCGTVNPGIAAFEIEYYHWIDEQQRQICELRTALQANITDIELSILVEAGLNHYYNLFRMKADAAKADVFYMLSGMWRTSAERFFLWIGGFRPSELLNVLLPHLQPLSDQQERDVSNLRSSARQAEDALSQGMEKLHQTLAQCIADPIAGTYTSQMVDAMEKLDALESFVNQADHLRQQTLLKMSSVLTTKQAARGLLSLGEYFRRLRALSSLWAARPRDSA